MKNWIGLALLVAAGSAQATTRTIPIISAGDPLAGLGANANTWMTITAVDSGAYLIGGTSTVNSNRFFFSGGAPVWYNTTQPTWTGSEASIGVADNGNWIYSPNVSGQDGVVTRDDGALLVEQNPIPGALTFSAFNSRPLMSANGTAFWVGGYRTAPASGTTLGRILFRKRPGQPIENLLQTGQVINGLAATNSAPAFTYSVSANGNNYVNEANLGTVTTTDTHILFNTNTVLAREGSAVAGVPGAVWGSVFQTNAVNDAGQWAIAGRIVENSFNLSSVVTANSVLRPGTPIGITQTDAAGCRFMTMNNEGFVAMVWGSTAGGQLFVGHVDRLLAARPIMEAGDQIDTNGDFIADATLDQIVASSGTGSRVGFTQDKTVFANIVYTPLAGGGQRNAMVRVLMARPGDSNRDGEIGAADFSELAAAYDAVPGDPNWNPHVDYNWDGEIGAADFSILAANYDS